METAHYRSRSGVYGSFDDSTLPSAIRDWEAQHLLGAEEDLGAYSDSEQTHAITDEFADYSKMGSSKGTGRLRRKIASRTKGGAFVQQTQKRRIYSCCIGSEIDTVKLHEYLDEIPVESSPMKSQWASELYTDTLHISRKLDGSGKMVPVPVVTGESDILSGVTIRPAFQSFGPSPEPRKSKESASAANAGRLSAKFHFSVVKEIFVFEFGAVVFWGFSVGEELEMLNLIRQFVSTKLSIQESLAICDDDCALVLVSPDSEIAIVSDILYLPENTVTKQRLAMSFALGQSVILSLFESQVEIKIPQYNHIPITLATVGRIKDMTLSDVGRLIGELFVIRHNLNLHTDILDTPDYFWDVDNCITEYQNIWKYLEMDIRVEVLNKRLDMIKELLDLLQFHVERSEMNGLEWIIIILIVVYCFIEVGGILL